MLRRLLENLARICFQNPGAAFVLASLPALALGLWALRVPIDLTFTGIVDQETGETARYFEISREYNLGGYLLTLVELSEAPQPDEGGAVLETPEQTATIEAAVADLEEVLRESSLVLSVQPPSDPEWWLNYAAWLVDGQLFDDLTALVQGTLAPERAVELADQVAEAPLLDDPPGVRLVQVRMANDPLAMSIGRWDFFEVERLVREEVLARHPGVEIRFAGMPAVAAQDQSFTLNLVQRLTPASLLLVLALFAFVERRWQSVLAVLWILVLAMAATLGLVGLLTGGLTLMETFFGVTVFGLGVDFAVHLFARLREETARGRPLEEAVAATLRGTGRGVVAGAVTTAGAFLIVAVAPDPVALHLGLSGGIGLFLCLILMLLILPAVWRWSGPRRQVAAARDEKHPILEKPSLFAVRHPRTTLLGTGALMLVALLGLLRFEFETDVSKVLNRKVESMETVQRIQTLYELNGAPWVVTLDSRERAREVAQAFRDSELFASATTLADLLPSDEVEIERRRSALQSLRPRLVLLRQMVDGAQRAAAAGQPPSPLLAPLIAQLPAGWSLDRALAQFARLLSALERAPELGPPTVDTLPTGLAERFESPSGDQLVIAYAKGSSLDALAARQQREVAQEIDPGATSISVLLETLMLGDRPWIKPTAVAIMVFVIVVLLVDFRRPRIAVLALMPVVVGLAGTVGLLCWFGVRFNIMTLTVLPLLCGLGVDDGIHVVHRMLEDRFRQPAYAAAAVGRAVLMTTLTTCSSFAVLLFTDHPGLETMSKVMLVGLPICWLSSVITLPAMATVLFRDLVEPE